MNFLVDKNDILGDLETPETWPNLLSFTHWWLNKKMPIIPPPKARVYVTDDASAVSIFKHDVYQVEMYLIAPDTIVEKHGHPGLDIIQMCLINNSIDKVNISQWGYCTVLPPGHSHGTGGGFFHDCGICMLVFEKWPTTKITSASVVWNGKTQGEKHSALVNEHYPGAVISGSNYSILNSSRVIKDSTKATDVN